MRNFEYFEPKTIKEACGLLKKYGKECQVIAGGSDLLVKMKGKLLSVSYLMSIQSIPNLDQIKYDPYVGVAIGPLATHSDIIYSPIIQEHFPLLAQASSSVGGVQVRNLGTLGGNICNASPASDASVALMALGANLEVTGCQGKREIPIQDFFLGPGLTALQADEILTEIRMKKQEGNTKGVFLKLGIKKAMQIGIVTVAVALNAERNSKTVKEIRIALGSVAPTPVRALKAEQVIQGNPFKEKIIKKASEDAVLNTSPMTDIRGTAEYRREMVKVLVKRALKQMKENWS